jgi:exonuclease VII large subunit
MSDMQKELINTQKMLCEERQEAYQFRKDLGDIMEQYGHSRDEQIDLFLEKILKENNDSKHDQRELDRLSELEHIIWTDFYGEKEVIDDTKAYILSRDFKKIKKEHHGYKKGYERLKEFHGNAGTHARTERIKELTKQVSDLTKELMQEGEKLDKLEDIIRESSPDQILDNCMSMWYAEDR